MEEIFDTFSHDVEYDYNLQNKHLFKKKTGNAKQYYQLIFDDTLENDLKVLSKLYKENIPFKIFGAHTNLYITDNGYDGLFVDMSSKNSEIVFDEKEKTFHVTSNVTVSQFVNYTMEMGYDFAAFTGIPGLIGSGVVGNSGWTPTGKDFSSFVKQITVYDFENDKMVIINPDDNFFKARDSFIKQQNKDKTRFFVKEVILKSDYIGENAVREKYNAQIEKRKISLKFGFQEGTAGSLWSNAHLKKIVGKSFPDILRENPTINENFNGARYSSYGSLFFTTDSNTTDKDVAKLFSHTLNKVKMLYNVDLHKEVMILDKDGEIDVETFINRNIYN